MDKFDVAIVGAGVAGMTAALYALRNGKSVLIFEEETIGGQIAASPKVENFPSIKSIRGEELSRNLYEQITAFGAETEFGKVTEIDKRDGVFRLKTDFGEFEAVSVILANGVRHKVLRVPGGESLLGKGVSYCAICDGAFYTDQEVALVGDGNTALQYSVLLSDYCAKVYVYTLFDKFFGDQAMINALKKRENIIWRPNTEITALEGEDYLERIVYVENGEKKVHEIPALFVAIGQVPMNGEFKEWADTDSEGYFITDETMKTKTPGLFVAGDCRRKNIRQLTTAVSDGAVAGIAASAYVDTL